MTTNNTIIHIDSYFRSSVVTPELDWTSGAARKGVIKIFGYLLRRNKRGRQFGVGDAIERSTRVREGEAL